MKARRLWLPALAGCLALGACTSGTSVSEGEYLVDGFLKNVPDSSVLSLYKEDGHLLRRVQQDTVMDGRFAFRDSIEPGEARKRLLLADSEGFPGRWLTLWVASGERIEVVGSDCLLQTWHVRSNVPEQQDENAFNEAGFPEKKQQLAYSAQESDLFRKARGGKIDWPKVDSLRRLSAPLDSIVTLRELAYLQEAPVTRVWIDKYASFAPMLQYQPDYAHIGMVRALYDRMSEADRATETGKLITEYMHLPPVVGVGDQMVDGDLYDTGGQLRHLSEFKGRYILLDFWSRGCGPCVESIPELEEVAAHYKDVLTVVSICSDPKDGWLEYVAEKKLSGNQWNELRRGNTGLAAAYQVKGIPHYVMIGPDGKIVRVWGGYGKGSLKKQLKDLLGK